MKKALIITLAWLFSQSMLAEKVKMDTKDLLTRIHDINQEEIAVGELAISKAASDKIKKYGDRLVKDHTKADRKVLEVAREENVDMTSSAPSSSGNANQAVTKTALLTELKALSGAQFDKRFIEAMKKGHEDAIQLLESADVSDKKVAKLVKKLLPELKEHHKLAEKLTPTAESETR